MLPHRPFLFAATTIAEILTITLLLAACGGGTITATDLFVPNVGDFLRVSGPGTEPDTGANVSVYQGAAGQVVLKIVDAGSQPGAQYAVETLPTSATDVGYDAALGQREGVFFTFNNEYHAAWSNGNWVFVITADSPNARSAFLASYGF